MKELYFSHSERTALAFLLSIWACQVPLHLKYTAAWSFLLCAAWYRCKSPTLTKIPVPITGTSYLVLFVGRASVLQFPQHQGDRREEAWMRVKNRRPILFGGKKYDQLLCSLLLSLSFALGLCVLRQSWNGSPWHRAASLFVTTAALTQLFPIRARRYLVPFDRWIWGLFSCSQVKAVTEQRCLKAVMWLRSAPIPVVLSVSACRQCYPQIQA